MLLSFSLRNQPVNVIHLIANPALDVVQADAGVIVATAEQRGDAINEKPRLPQETAGGFQFGEFDVHDDPFGQSFAVRRILGIAAANVSVHTNLDVSLFCGL
jgi:hypothetical protein